MITLEEELKLFYEISQVLSEAGLEPEAATGTPATADEPDATVGNVGMQKAYSPEETALMNLAAARQQAGGDTNNAAYKSALQAAQNAMVPILMQGSKRIPSSLLKRGDRDEFVNNQFIKPGFADTLADLGDKLQSGQPTNLNSYFTSALINSAKDTSKKGRKEKNVGGDDDDASSDPITNKAYKGDAPDAASIKRDEIAIAKRKYQEKYGRAWTPGAEMPQQAITQTAPSTDVPVNQPPVEQPGEAPEPQDDAPESAPQPSAGAPKQPEVASQKTKGKSADIEIPPIDPESFEQAIQAFKHAKLSTGKPTVHAGKDYGILVGKGWSALKNPELRERLIKSHLLTVDPETGKPTINLTPTHHKDIYNTDPQTYNRDVAGELPKPSHVQAKMQATLKAFKKFLLTHHDFTGSHEGRSATSKSLAQLQRDAASAESAATSNPTDAKAVEQAQKAKEALDAEMKRLSDETSKVKNYDKGLLAQHGNDAARSALAKKAKAAKQPAAQAAAAVAPAEAPAVPDASAPAEPAQAEPAADAQQAAPDAAPAPEPAAPAEKPKKAKAAPKPPATTKDLRLQTGDPNASLDPDAPPVKAPERMPLTLKKTERPEERQAHHVAGDLADAEAEFADLPPEHQHAMHPVGRKLASKIDQLHKEYKGIRNTGQKLSRSKEKLKLAKKNPVAMPAPKAPVAAVPDPNAAPDSPSVDYSLHGASPNESKSLAGRIFNEDMAKTYRIVSERVVKFLGRLD